MTDYLLFRMAYDTRECLHVLYLDAANRLLLDEVAATGTVDEVVLYPREIIRRALELGATALVLAHNHPSGDPMPSNSDRGVTRRLASAAASLDIRIHDHLIVAASGVVSLREAGLL